MSALPLLIRRRSVRDFESVIHLDAEIPHGALDFSVAQQQLDRSEISGALVDQCGFGPAQRVRAV